MNALTHIELPTPETAEAPLDANRLSGAPTLSVVVPAYREAGNIALLVRALDASLKDIFWEVIFVDDDSPDGTTDVVRSIAANDKRVRGLRRVGRRGLSGAVIEGILSSSSEFVAVMDCDLQHDERILPRLLEGLQGGADIAIATRYLGEGSADAGFSGVRQAGSTLATKLAQLVAKTEISDPMSGFFMLRRPVFDTLASRLSSGGFKILLDILSSSPVPLKAIEVPYTFRPRASGESKLSSSVIVEYLGLLVSKMSGGIVPPRFLMFALVGISGVAIHLVALKLALSALALSFAWAQLAATYSAMLWNFLLNNHLTYRDRRLRGFAAVKGFFVFCAICSIGTIANVGVAQLVYSNDPDWLLAGVAGALMAAVFNYSASSVITWRKT